MAEPFDASAEYMTDVFVTYDGDVYRSLVRCQGVIPPSWPWELRTDYGSKAAEVAEPEPVAEPVVEPEVVEPEPEPAAEVEPVAAESDLVVESEPDAPAVPEEQP